MKGVRPQYLTRGEKNSARTACRIKRGYAVILHTISLIKGVMYYEGRT